MTERPAGTGWWWWRQDEGDVWRALQVRTDPTNGELYVAGPVEETDYQCDSDPQHEWYGEWWSEPIAPPQ
ncbi:hypothetical protein [Luteolibacter sp. Populi]|uniref:hypothetical protein n=1 Tax=Luteolibacter sp. Populi TaxID=3230487 RepID=UPI00346669E2